MHKVLLTHVIVQSVICDCDIPNLICLERTQGKSNSELVTRQSQKYDAWIGEALQSALVDFKI